MEEVISSSQRECKKCKFYNSNVCWNEESALYGKGMAENDGCDYFVGVKKYYFVSCAVERQGMIGNYKQLCMDIHPMEFLMKESAKRRNWLVFFWSEIPKEYYEWGIKNYNEQRKRR